MITNDIMDAWRRGRKTQNTPSGWVKGNACCCIHHGESIDSRGRGGMIQDHQSISYHCFNCGFKIHWKQGWFVTQKFRKFLKWLGMSDSEITKISLQAIQKRQFNDIEGIDNEDEEHYGYSTDFEMPEGTRSFGIEDLNGAVHQYLISRNLDDIEVLINENELANRFIIPFKYQGCDVGYTARSIIGHKVKYLSNAPPNFVFNLDAQKNKDVVLVHDGVLDACVTDGVAVLKSEVSDFQADMIAKTGLQPVLVPDADQAGMRLVERAIELGWWVSFPEWLDTCKDAAKANEDFGLLYTMRAIHEGIEQNPLKIKLLSRRYA